MGIYIQYILYNLVLILYLNCGGGGDFFLNIEKRPFTYWLNGRWFLQIVDIGNFNMKLNGRWFPQIVDQCR